MLIPHAGGRGFHPPVSPCGWVTGFDYEEPLQRRQMESTAKAPIATNSLYLRNSQQWNWYGEGDDMIFIDCEGWLPSLHGTGTEDYFNTAWGPQHEYSAPYYSITRGDEDNQSGEVSLFGFHTEDPVTFERSIQVTIEHGHANKRSDDYSQVAYWYQAEPHRPFSILPVRQRVPRQGQRFGSSVQLVLE